MNRAVRWLLLVPLIVIGFVYYGEVVRAQTGNTVSIICSQYLRAEPEDGSSRVGLMNPGEAHAVLGRYGSWVYLQIDADLQGWAYDGICLTVNVDFETLPVLDPTQVGAVQAGPPEASVVCSQYLRSFPSMNSTSIKVMDAADNPLSVSGLLPDGGWILVATAGGEVGWTAFTNCLSTRGDFYSVPVVEAEQVYAGPPVLDVLCTQYLRAQPNLDATRVATMQVSDDHWRIAGRDVAGSWFLVSNASDTLSGWTANGSCVNLLGSFSEIPIVSDDVSTYGGPPMARLACPQNLRDLPSLDGQRVAVLDSGAGALNLMGRNPTGSWVYVSAATGLEGWLSASECLTIQGDVYALLIRSPYEYAGPPSAVIACDQPLLTQPVADAPRAGMLGAGNSPLTVFGRTVDNNWLYFEVPGGASGWAANAGCVRVVGDVADAATLISDSDAEVPLPGGPTPLARIQCTQYLRSGPSMESTRLVVMQPGDYFTIDGRSGDGSWLHLKGETVQGWAAWGSGCLSVQGDIYSTPLLDEAYTGPAIATVGCTQYLRALPDGNATRLATLTGAEGALSVSGRSSDGRWMQITMDDGTVGWAATGVCLSVLGDFLAVPVVQASVPVYSGPTVADVICDVNLRRTPTSGGEVMAVISADSGLFDVIARDANANWVLVEHSSGLVGWMGLGSCVTLQGSVAGVPVPRGATGLAEFWTVLRAEGACSGGDQASQVIAAYNRSAPIGAVSRECTSEAQGLLALAQSRAEIAIVNGSCGEYPGVSLGSGQSLCYRAVHTTQVDDFLSFVSGQ